MTIDVREVRGVTVLTLSSGKVNAMDVDLLNDVTSAVHELERNDATPLVLTGAGQAFSAGVDLVQVLDGGPDYAEALVAALSAAFVSVFGFPGPTVAAINGAAIAGGCVLACACDLRLLAPDGLIGASELRVGVPFPAAALEILRYACGDHAEEVMLGGRLYRGPDALTCRLVHTVVDDDVVAQAVAEAAELGSIAAGSYRNTKAQLRGPALSRIADAAVDDEVRRIWASPGTAAAIRSHLERLRRR
jgi:enoyl-CoA hydratase/carnithine racemase